MHQAGALLILGVYNELTWSLILQTLNINFFFSDNEFAEIFEPFTNT